MEHVDLQLGSLKGLQNYRLIRLEWAGAPGPQPSQIRNLGAPGADFRIWEFSQYVSSRRKPAIVEHNLRSFHIVAEPESPRVQLRLKWNCGGSQSTKTEVRAKIDVRVKEQAQAIYAAAGLTLSDAFRIMLKRTVAGEPPSIL